jgi:hypothetical protein
MAELRGLMPADREERLIAFVRERVARTLRIASDRALDRRQRLMDMGLDSLMAVELRNSLENGLGLGGMLPATLIFDYPTIDGIVGYLESNFFSEVAAPTTLKAAPAKPAESEPGVNVEGMSDDEVAALLMKKLGDL